MDGYPGFVISTQLWDCLRSEQENEKAGLARLMPAALPPTLAHRTRQGTPIFGCADSGDGEVGQRQRHGAVWVVRLTEHRLSLISIAAPSKAGKVSPRSAT